MSSGFSSSEGECTSSSSSVSEVDIVRIKEAKHSKVRRGRGDLAYIKSILEEWGIGEGKEEK